MTKLQDIRDFLGKHRLAMVGVSRNPSHFTRTLFREFRQRGYDMVPVNPAQDQVDGLPCFARVQDVRPPVDGVLVMTPSWATENVVADCAKAGIPRVWMYRAAGTGSVSPEAVKFCEANGIQTIAGECPLMFFEPSAWIHRAHGFCKKMIGSYPA